MFVSAIGLNICGTQGTRIRTRHGDTETSSGGEERGVITPITFSARSCEGSGSVRIADDEISDVVMRFPIPVKDEAWV